ncbi:MAG: right-handed parallel beta-helix repeat-containing protein [Candidatus Hydrogenedentota bacterium]
MKLRTPSRWFLPALVFAFLGASASPARAALWYVNDNSTVGDSFTSAVGATANNGLTPATPKRFLNDLDTLVAAGDTILVDSGYYPEPDTVVILASDVAILGMDSRSTIIDFADSSSSGARAIFVENAMRMLFRDFSVQNAFNGIWWRTVGQSAVERVGVRNAGNHAFLLDSGSSGNRISWSTVQSPSKNGVKLESTVGITLSNLFIQGCGLFGVAVETGVNHVLENNISFANALSGFNFLNCTSLAVRGNIGQSNTVNGFQLTAVRFCTFSQNIAAMNASYGFSLDTACSQVQFRKNYSFGAGASLDSAFLVNAFSGIDLRRNWWNTIDTRQVFSKIRGTGRFTVEYTPFRLGTIDTTIGIDTVAPRAPDTLAVIAVDTVSLRVTWSASSASEESAPFVAPAGYRLFRSLSRDTSSWYQIAALGATTFAHVDSPLSPATEHFYRVTAVDSASMENQSFYSDLQEAGTTGEISFPTSFALLAPPNGLDTNQLQITFSWSTSSDSSPPLTYTLVVDSDMAGALLVETTISGLSATVTFLSSDTYRWRVIATDTYGNKRTAGDSLFRIDQAPPTQSVLMRKNGDTFITPVTLAWTASIDTISGLAYYIVQVDTGGGFVSPLESVVLQPGDTDHLSTRSAPDTYFWRVLAYDTAGNVSISTGVPDSFRILYIDTTGPVAFFATAPVDRAETSAASFLLQWSNAADDSSPPVRYRVQVDTAGSFVSNVVDSSGFTDTFFLVFPPSNDSFFWRVIATDNAGNTTTINSAFRFVTDTTPPSIALSAPAAAHETTNVFVTFSWTSSDTGSGVDTFRLQFDTSGLFTSLLVDSLVFSTSASRTLAANDTYYWRVVAIDNALNTAASSARFIVIDTAPPATVILASPANLTETTATTIRFAWNATIDTGAGFSFFRLQCDTAGSFAAPFVDSATGDSTAASRTFAAGANFLWRVLAVDQLGNLSNSDSRRVTLRGGGPTVPSFLLPANNAETQSTQILFAWTASTDSFWAITQYCIQVETAGTFSALLLDSSTGTSTSGAVSLSAGLYNIRIRVTNESGSFAYSDTRTIRIDTSVAVTLFSPGDSSTTTETRPVLLWSVDALSAGGDTFTLELRADSSGGSLIEQATVNATSRQAATSLAARVYYWRIMAQDNAGNRDTSAWFRFTVDLTPGLRDTVPPASFTLLLPGDSHCTGAATISLRWNFTTDTRSGVWKYRARISTDTFCKTGIILDTTIAASANRIDVRLAGTKTYFWYVVATDYANNSRATSIRAILLDTMPPSTPTPKISPFAGEDTTADPIAFRVTASVDTLAGVRRYRIQIDSAGSFVSLAFDSYSSSNSVALSGIPGGTWYWRAAAEDSAGNVSGWTGADTFRAIRVTPRADFSGDGRVGRADVEMIMGRYGKPALFDPAFDVAPPPDGKIDAADLFKMGEEYGK